MSVTDILEADRPTPTQGIGYTVDATGTFGGNRVEGSTLPNWVGDARTTEQLQPVVEGDRMHESHRRPDGTRIAITWKRVRKGRHRDVGLWPRTTGRVARVLRAWSGRRAAYAA